MKKIRLLVFAMLVIAAQGVYAQNDVTAYSISNTAFQDGTARSAAMGNALTALGGDLGSINFNPAGVAVYKFTEIGFTPALTTVTTKSDLFGTSTKSTRNDFGIANTGGVFYFPISSGRHSLKNINFGFTYSNLCNYATSERNIHNGNTSDPTYLDFLANFTTKAANSFGLTAEEFSEELDRNASQNPYSYLGSALWPSVLAWNTSLLDLNADGSAFVATEQHEINQSFKRKSWGYNGAADLSMGFNFGDVLYLGANFTINSINNRVKEIYSEDGVGAQDFKFMDYSYNQKTTGSGIAGKLGIIVNPAPFVRFGAAVSTPTLYDLTDRAHWEMTSSLGGDYYQNLRTPTIEMDYQLTTPFKYNFGFALVFPVAALSIDYEGTNFSHMKFHSASHGPDEDYDWGYMNDFIKQCYKRQDKIRAGLEINPAPFLSLRAGFQYSNSGIKDIDLDQYVGSLGVGFSTSGGFFADLGFSTTLKKTDYLFDSDNLLLSYIGSNARNKCSRSTWKALLTIGFRF